MWTSSQRTEHQLQMHCVTADTWEKAQLAAEEKPHCVLNKKLQSFLIKGACDCFLIWLFFIINEKHRAARRIERIAFVKPAMLWEWYSEHITPHFLLILRHPFGMSSESPYLFLGFPLTSLHVRLLRKDKMGTKRRGASRGSGSCRKAWRSSSDSTHDRTWRGGPSCHHETRG